MQAIKNKIHDIQNELKNWEEKFPEVFENIHEFQKDILTKLGRFESEAQKLSIGIIGQVKAGKSSFLNTLLFKGKSLLPEAITPETANLTKISYAPKPELVVYFYSQCEWQELVNLAQSNLTNAEAKVAKSLIALANKHNVDVNAVLIDSVKRISATDIDALMLILKDYVGADGKYTALVKSTELYLDYKELEGFDIVDTPGMNDPVKSRTQKTRDYMAECDMVFFISHCSRFLDAADTDLLSRLLPQKGVKHIVLVGSQFDSALDDAAADGDSLRAVEKSITAGFTRRATNEMEKLALQKEELGNIDLANILRNLKTPILCSSYAYRFVNWPASSWSGSMKKVYENFEYHVEDFWNKQSITHEDWHRIANFSALDEAFNFARQEKNNLLEQQKMSLIPEANGRLFVFLSELNQLAEQRVAFLSQNDLADIERQKNHAGSQIDRISNALAFEFDDMLVLVSNKYQEVIGQISSDKNRVGQLQERTGTRTETHSYSVSTSKWYNPFSWGSSRREYYTTTEQYTYIATADAIEKAIGFQRSASFDVERAFNGLIRADMLKARLRKTLLQVIDTKSEQFNPNLFRASFESAIANLSIPTLKLNMPDMSTTISQQFTSKEIKGSSEQARLKSTLDNVINLIYESLALAFKESVTLLEQQISQLTDNLRLQFSQQIQNELSMLTSQLANKKDEIDSYSKLLFKINDLIND